MIWGKKPQRGCLSYQTEKDPFSGRQRLVVPSFPTKKNPSSQSWQTKVVVFLSLPFSFFFIPRWASKSSIYSRPSQTMDVHSFRGQNSKTLTGQGCKTSLTCHLGLIISGFTNLMRFCPTTFMHNLCAGYEHDKPVIFFLKLLIIYIERR